MVLLHRVGKGIGSVVGLGQEAYSHSKAQQEAAHEVGEGTADFDGHIKEQWTQSGSPGASFAPSSKSNSQPFSSTTQSEVPRVGHLAAKVGGRLPAPVVIPQRRPNSRARGFINAYAPALSTCSVSESDFLSFLSGFEKAIHAQGTFHVLNFAVLLSNIAATAALGPSLVMHFSAMAVHMSLEAGRQLYMNKQTNTYLDEANSNLFQPRGLYAMIMRYDPASTKAEQEVADFDTTTAAAVGKHANSGASRLQDFRAASGKTLDAQMPEICPLLFLDSPSESGEVDGRSESTSKRYMKFTRDYYDRRGQASYAAHNPNSKLNVQEHEFAGRYSDPTTFENSGLLGVLTGGAVDPYRRKHERTKERTEKKGHEEPEGKEGGGLLRSVKSKLEEDVMYLLVVNMPSEEELEAAKQQIKAMNEGGEHSVA